MEELKEQQKDQYEPPKVEKDLGPEELEREAHYAGKPTGLR